MLRRCPLLPLALTLAAIGCQDVRSSDPDASVVGGGQPGATVDAGTGGVEPRFDGGLDGFRRDSGFPQPGMEDAGGPPPVPDVGPAPRRDAAPGAIDAALPPEPDAGPPETPDVECPLAWRTLDVDRPPACAARSVIALADAIDVRTVSVARSEGGRVALGWNVQESFDTGTFAVRVFDAAGNVTLRTELQPDSAFGETVGVASALTALREVFHLVTWRQSDFGHQVDYRQIRPDDVITPVEPVATLVGRNGAVDVVPATDGSIHVGWHDRSAGSHGARTRGGDGAWGEPFTFDDDLFTDQPGDGSVALAVDREGRLHAAYQVRTTAFNAIPRARVRIEGEWTIRRTLDNNSNERLSGVAIDVVDLGDRRAAAYLDWVGGTGEVRLATYGAADGPVDISVLLPGLPLPEQPPTFALAMQRDAAGLIHLVVHSPGGAGTSTLEYRRQARIGGNVRWLVDVIDDDVPDDPAANLLVDLALDPEGSAHIIYANPAAGLVFYAVRLR